MPIERETLQVGEHTYVMETLGAITGRQVFLRLARPAGAILAKAVGAMASTAGRRPGIRDLDWVSVSAGLGEALAVISDEDLAFVCEKLAAKCTLLVDDPKSGGQKQHPMPLASVFDSHFAGRYEQMVLWLWWGIRVNRFFGSALAMLEAAVERAKTSGFASPTDATGGSGESSSASG